MSEELREEPREELDINADEIAAEHAAHLEKVKKRAMTVTMVLSGLPKSKVIDPHQQQKIRADLKVEGKAIRTTKTLFGCHHSAVKAYSAAAACVMATRNRFTMAWVDSKGDAEGTRLIMESDIPAFEAQLAHVGAELQRSATEIVEKWEEVLLAEKAHLGDAFNVGDYPDKARVAAAGVLPVPIYSPCEDSGRLPAAIRVRQENEIAHRISASVDRAIEEVAADVAGVFTTLIDQLRWEKHIRPRSDHPWAPYRLTGKIVAEDRHAQDPSVPPGQVRVTLQVTADDKTKNTIEEIMSEAAYLSLEPSSPKRRGKLHASTLSKIQEMTKNLPIIREHLGPYGAAIDKALAAVGAVVRTDKPADKVCASLKSSDARAADFRENLRSVTRELVTQVGEETKVRKLSRSAFSAAPPRTEGSEA